MCRSDHCLLTQLQLPRCCADIYAPKVVGMMWSMLAQEQTWFGNEPWKSYGIQVCSSSYSAVRSKNIVMSDCFSCS